MVLMLINDFRQRLVISPNMQSFSTTLSSMKKMLDPDTKQNYNLMT